MPSSPTADARFLFFGGKGGVGKTTCAAAAAVSFEFRVSSLESSALALSLDPAHSLRDVLGANSKLETRNSKLIELDARAEFRAFMERHREDLRTIADRGTYLDDEDIQGFLDLSLPGLDEIMGLLKLGDLARAEEPRRVVVDLPPTGHALRLFDVSAAFEQLMEALELMQGKHRFAVSSLTRRYVEDAVDAFLDDLRASCRAARDMLFAAGTSAFVLVARPEAMVLAETARYAARLREMGAAPAGLVLNAAAGPVSGFEGTGGAGGRCVTLDAGGGPLSLPPELEGLPRVRVPWLEEPPLGRPGLEPVARAIAPLLGIDGKQAHRRPHPASPTAVREDPAGDLRMLFENPRRLTIFGGKGGVGKTTLAAATALALARQTPKRSVVAVSIDPAHSLGDSFGQVLGGQPRQVDGVANLLAVELDPRRQWRHFKEHWDAEGEQLFRGLPGGGHLDPVYDRHIAAQLGRIQPTGLDEIQAATAVIDLLDEDAARLVVVDSAPTGHLLRFLESPDLVLGWAKELMRILVKYGLASQMKRLSLDLLDLTRKTKRLQALLHDQEGCEVVVVALAEAPVMAETERLVAALLDMCVPIRRIVWNQAETACVPHIDTAGLRLEALRAPRQPRQVQGIKALLELVT